jgi:hypothetical protein
MTSLLFGPGVRGRFGWEIDVSLAELRISKNPKSINPFLRSATDRGRGGRRARGFASGGAADDGRRGRAPVRWRERSAPFSSRGDAINSHAAVASLFGDSNDAHRLRREIVELIGEYERCRGLGPDVDLDHYGEVERSLSELLGVFGYRPGGRGYVRRGGVIYSSVASADGLGVETIRAEEVCDLDGVPPHELN